MLLLVAAANESVGYAGAGDFTMAADGLLARREEGRTAPFVYAGVTVLSRRLFKETPAGAFSLNLLFDRAIERGRLFGMRLDGIWMHVGTPDAIGLAEAAIAESAA
jgi:MurNAc alpha-1-phosphate uridylyltransferase